MLDIQCPLKLPSNTTTTENEIAGVIFRLTQTPPSVQAETIDRYYLPSATFIHPFCRTGHSPHSRKLIHGIYRWYKIMSPKIELMVNTISVLPNARVI